MEAGQLLGWSWNIAGHCRRCARAGWQLTGLTQPALDYAGRKRLSAKGIALVEIAVAALDVGRATSRESRDDKVQKLPQMS